MGKIMEERKLVLKVISEVEPTAVKSDFLASWNAFLRIRAKNPETIKLLTSDYANTIVVKDDFNGYDLINIVEALDQQNYYSKNITYEKVGRIPITVIKAKSIPVFVIKLYNEGKYIIIKNTDTSWDIRLADSFAFVGNATSKRKAKLKIQEKEYGVTFVG